MKRALAASSLILGALLLSVIGCRSGGGDLSRAETQRQFGVRMARMNLWREAMFRFRRAAEIEPQSAMAHNNPAVAYEATGDFDAAAKEYREALRLDRSNEYIQKNYSRFVEFTQRSKKRDATRVVAGENAPGRAPATVTTTTSRTAEPPDPRFGVPPQPTTPPPPPNPVPPTDKPVEPTTIPPTTTANPPQEGSR